MILFGKFDANHIAIQASNILEVMRGISINCFLKYLNLPSFYP